MNLKELTDKELLGIVEACPERPGSWKPQGEHPVVLDFYVPWCKPCQAMVPLLEEVAGEYAGRVDFCQVNIDRERRTAVRFRVRHVPALIFISGGGVCRLETGAMTKAALREAVEMMIRN
ncbi:thioredoxin family protein [Rikenella microfusus]